MAKNYKKTESDTFTNKTGPTPHECTTCSFDFEKEVERKDERGRVNYLTCRDISRGKSVTNKPGFFIQQDSNYNFMGDSSAGYILKEKYVFISWSVFCDRCHSNMTKLQGINKKSIHMNSDSDKKQSMSGIIKKQKIN